MRQFRTKPTGRPRVNPLNCVACGREGKTVKGLCTRCYKRQLRHGDPTVVLPRGGKLGAENATWAGDSASYGGNHRRVYRARGKASHCEFQTGPACSARFQWAHVHGTDPGDPQNYISLCHLCHRRYDAPMLCRGLAASIAHGKLTAPDVVAIKARLAVGDTQTAIARDFGVSPSTISNIARRVTWAALD